MKNHGNHNCGRSSSSMSNVIATTGDRWSKLPADVLGLVVDRIVGEKDFIVFRAVCKDWRSVSYQRRTPSPWLLAKRYNSPNVVLKGLWSLHPSNDSLSSLLETELCWRYWGSFTGWILGQHTQDYGLKLINPLTKDVIHLPRLAHLIRKGLVYHTPASDSRNPTNTNTIGVMAISYSFNGIAMIHNEYKEWTFLADTTGIHKSQFADLVLYKDNVAAVRDKGAIVLFNEARVVRSYDSQPDLFRDYYEPYLVESSGDLLIIARGSVIARGYKVYRLNLDTGDWIHVTGLGGHSLFVGNSYSISRLISQDETGDTWRPSCIYNATYSSTHSGKLFCYNLIKQQEESHDLASVTDLPKCYDFIWYMPAAASN